MNYANPHHLSLAFASLFIMAVFYFWVMKRRTSIMKRFADEKLMEGIAPTVSSWRKIFRMSMMVCAVFLALLALARPQWGFQWEEIKVTGTDILIAVDVSRSMRAVDTRPDRLERSKYAIKDLVKKLSGDRIGLIAFAGTAFLQCPLTIDYDGFILALEDLSTDTIPRPGTSITSAIREAINVFKGPDMKYKVLIIVTDGEDFEGDAQAAAREAAQLGIKIYCVGVGTSDGDLIPAAGEYGDRGYLTDRGGNVVKTRLNEALLKNVAILTGGSYVRATQSEFGLVLLYNMSISKLEKRDIESKMKKHYHERFQYFLSIALLLLFIEPLISGRKRAA